jgi:hypothetical protein
VRERNNAETLKCRKFIYRRKFKVELLVDFLTRTIVTAWDPIFIAIGSCEVAKIRASLDDLLQTASHHVITLFIIVPIVIYAQGVELRG